MAKQVIILFGPPGAGKGTQAELLAEKTHCQHVESSKVIEATMNEGDPERTIEIEGQVYKMKDEQQKWKTGLLNSFPFVAWLIKEKIKEVAGQGKGIIFSGSPRSLYEAGQEIPLLKELYGLENIHFFLLEVTPETTIFRNSHRKICELMRHSILFNKETEKLKACPLDGSDLIKRKGLDDPKTIKKRLEVFKENTLPVAEFCEKQGVKINRINAEQPVSKVFEDICKKLKT